MQEKNIVLFDMDNTLVSADTMQLWGDFLFQKGIIDSENKQMRENFHQDYIVGKLDFYASYQHDIATIRNIDPNERITLRRIFFQTCVKQRISTKGLQLIANYKNDPDTIVILITATISFIAYPVALFSRVDSLIATQEEMMDGDYTGKVFGTPSIGKGKVERFHRWLEKNGVKPLHTVLYSDSINDLPLLNIVKEPIIVDPDHMLESVAIKNRWKIISLKNSIQVC